MSRCLLFWVTIHAPVQSLYKYHPGTYFLPFCPSARVKSAAFVAGQTWTELALGTAHKFQFCAHEKDKTSAQHNIVSQIVSSRTLVAAMLEISPPQRNLNLSALDWQVEFPVSFNFTAQDFILTILMLRNVLLKWRYFGVEGWWYVYRLRGGTCIDPAILGQLQFSPHAHGHTDHNSGVDPAKSRPVPGISFDSAYSTFSPVSLHCWPASGTASPA